jgi:trk system potassium uptake protein TrkH
MHVPGLMALISLPLCWLFHEGFAVVPLLVTAAVALVPGQLLFHTCRHAEKMGLRPAMVTTVASWLVIPLIGTLPFLLIAADLAADPQTPESVLVFRDFTNALFESMSGFTGTGLTLAVRPSELPYCLQWWRSLTQWIGGVGVIVLMLSVFHPSSDAYRLYFSEGRQKTILPDVAASVRAIWWIYLLYTGLGIGLLRFAGMDWWQAVNYGMTGISTGGFGITDNSLGDFGPGPRIVMIGILFTGAISFAVHFHLLTTRRLSPLRRDLECQTLVLLSATGCLLLILENRWYGASGDWLDAVFQWSSAITTGGFSTLSIEDWSPTSHLLLSLAMVCGGAAGATTGGLKLKRVILLVQGASARIRGLALHPWRLMEHKPIADPEAEVHAVRTLEAAAIMAVLWTMTTFLGTVLLLHAAGPQVSLHQAILEVSSALGNVGLTSGITTAELCWPGKLSLVLIMWMGRLEIVPVLVLVGVLITFPRHGGGGHK